MDPEQSVYLIVRRFYKTLEGLLEGLPKSILEGLLECIWPPRRLPRTPLGLLETQCWTGGSRAPPVPVKVVPDPSWNTGNPGIQVIGSWPRQV